jgi:hypothetical protein
MVERYEQHDDETRAKALRHVQQFEHAVGSAQSPSDYSAAIEAADELAKSKWDMGAQMLIAAASRIEPASRLWAACLLANAHGLAPDAYLSVASQLLVDEDQSIRSAAMESFLFYEPHPDLRWSDAVPLVRQIFLNVK